MKPQLLIPTPAPLGEIEKSQILELLNLADDKTLALMYRGSLMHADEEARRQVLAHTANITFVKELSIRSGIRAVAIRVDCEGKATKMLPHTLTLALTNMIKSYYGDGVLVIILGESEEIEDLNIQEMALRGWIPLPGTGMHEKPGSAGSCAD